MTYAEYGAQADTEIALLTAERDTLILERDQLAAALEECRNPPPKPKPTMRVGSSLWRAPGESLDAAYQRRVETWGVAPEVVRVFAEGNPGTVPPFDAAVVYSFKGTDETAFRNMLDSMRPKDRWCYYHEPEDNVESGQWTAQEWRDRFTHLISIADNDPEWAKLKRGPILMQWTLDPKSGRQFEDYVIPGADWYGWDVYTKPGDIGVAYARCREASQSVGANWLIAEAGLKDPNLCGPEATASYVSQASGIARELGAKAWLYYDALMSSGHDFRLNTQVEYDAMRAAIES